MKTTEMTNTTVITTGGSVFGSNSKYHFPTIESPALQGESSGSGLSSSSLKGSPHTALHGKLSLKI